MLYPLLPDRDEYLILLYCDCVRVDWINDIEIGDC